MYKIIYRKQAKEDFQDIFSFIAKDSPEYAGKVIFKIKNTIGNLWYFPYLWKKYGKTNRMIINSKYKYKIMYMIENENIYILTIFKFQNIY